MPLQSVCGTVQQWEVVGSVTVLVIEPNHEFKDVPETYWPLLDAALLDPNAIICVTYEDTQDPPRTALHVEPRTP